MAEDYRKMEERLRAVENELRYEVVKKEGPIVRKLEKVVETVEELNRQSVSKKEIETALNNQTKKLQNHGNFTFSRRVKFLGGLTGLLVVALEIYQAGFK